MAVNLHYFGIRHHGPGSARRLRDALDALRPSLLLVEGPSDADALLAHLGDPRMVPPVALLSHAVERPQLATFHPFAEFSPEYQAITWALRHSAPVNFIDLPSSIRLASNDAEGDEPDPTSDPPPADAADLPAAEVETPSSRLRRDPIGEIARAAGYEDGESWWHDWIESGHGHEPGQTEMVFAAVHAMMAALREDEDDAGIDLRERQREAHMRLAIASASRGVEGPVAVVCGAWHVPALQQRHKAGDDRALLKGLPKTAVHSTWVPWTNPRLACATGYAAGVDAPRWYAHLWRHGMEEDALARWMVGAARVFRDAGAQASPASVIEAVRMASILAGLRGRPGAGYEEVREAAIACLCDGEPLAWHQHEAELLLGSDVGEIPPDTPLMPLLEDLQRQQKATRLKPEALERDLALDLRSESGNARSVLLHRLRLLDVPWGRRSDAGGSRGTFRERWTLRWEPEYAVRLVEHLVHGATIEQAASGRSRARLVAESRMSAIADLINACMEAQLPDAVESGIVRLADSAAHAQECQEMLAALPPLLSLQRYGTARRISLDRIGGLVERLLAQAALALPYAARNLDADQAGALCEAIARWHEAMPLVEFDMDLWWQALDCLLDDALASRRVAGLAARLLHEDSRLGGDALQLLMRSMLSPGVETAQAAQFFEGFFAGAAGRLLYQADLLAAVDAWLSTLDGELFREQLPLLRRVLSSLDMVERRRLLDRVTKPQARTAGAERIDPARIDEWQAQAARLIALLNREPVAWPN